MQWEAPAVSEAEGGREMGRGEGGMSAMHLHDSRRGRFPLRLVGCFVVS